MDSASAWLSEQQCSNTCWFAHFVQFYIVSMRSEKRIRASRLSHISSMLPFKGFALSDLHIRAVLQGYTPVKCSDFECTEKKLHIFLKNRICITIQQNNKESAHAFLNIHNTPSPVWKYTIIRTDTTAEERTQLEHLPKTKDGRSVQGDCCDRSR